MVINEVVVCLTVTQTSTNFNQMWLRTIHMCMPVSATVAFSITSSVPLYLITLAESELRVIQRLVAFGSFRARHLSTTLSPSITVAFCSFSNTRAEEVPLFFFWQSTDINKHPQRNKSVYESSHNDFMMIKGQMSRPCSYKIIDPPKIGLHT